MVENAGKEEFAELISKSTGFRTARVITTAVRMEIFDRLGEEFKTPEELRTPREDLVGLTHVLNALVSLDLLEKEQDMFRCSPVAEAFLTEGGRYDARPIFELYHRIYEMWGELERAIYEGQSMEIGPKPTTEWGPDFIAAMEARAVFEREEVAQQVKPYANGGRVLDLGGGSGIYTRALLEMDQEATGVLADLPHVVELAEQYIEEDGLSERLDVEPLDLVESGTYGTNFDLVFVSAILHIFGPETNRNIISRAYDSLQEGGYLIIRDYVLDNSETGPEGAVLFGIHMYLATEEGDVYTFEEYRSWLEEAGFTFETRIDLDNSSELLVARK